MKRATRRQFLILIVIALVVLLCAVGFVFAVPVLPVTGVVAIALRRAFAERPLLRIAHRPVSVSLRAPPLVSF